MDKAGSAAGESVLIPSDTFKVHQDQAFKQLEALTTSAFRTSRHLCTPAFCANTRLHVYQFSLGHFPTDSVTMLWQYCGTNELITLGAMNAPPHPRYPSNSRRSHSRDFHPQVSPISSQSPDVQRRSYSPLSDADQAILPNDNATMPPPASDASSALSDIQDESDDLSTRSHSGTPSHSSELATDSDNETEAETERLHISPQKARDQIIDEGLEDNQDEATNGTAIVRPGLRPQDILSDEIEEDPQTSDSESSRAGEHGLRSPNALAGHKRKRNGALSPTMGHSSPDGQSPRKRSSIRRSFGLQAPKQPAEDVELADAVDAVLSSSEDEEDAIRKIELARHGSLTPAPEIEEQLDAARVEVETEEAVEADNEDDEAEAAAKTEDDGQYIFQTNPKTG